MISLSISSTSLRPCSRCATERRGGVEESKAPTMARAPLRSASLPSTTVSTTSLRTFAPRVDETTSSKDFRSSSPSGAEAYSSSIDLQRFSTRFAAHSSAAGLPFGASFCRMRTGALPPWTWDWAPPRTSCELPPPPENFCWAAICRSRACCRCWSRAWDWSAPCEDPPRCCCCCCCGLCGANCWSNCGAPRHCCCCCICCGCICCCIIGGGGRPRGACCSTCAALACAEVASSSASSFESIESSCHMAMESRGGVASKPATGAAAAASKPESKPSDVRAVGASLELLKPPPAGGVAAAGIAVAHDAEEKPVSSAAGGGGSASAASAASAAGASSGGVQRVSRSALCV
mmetsp:Transcript_8106/g.26569  ORF Transcript_8106/g.26569 Transcript_8106/m.26569 type:complete len:348 (+) Transcript_8106:868-1911(+)